MSITGTTAQGQHPCWDVRVSYCLTDCFHFDACHLYTSAVSGCRWYQRGLMIPCSSSLRADQMFPGPDFNRIISYDPVFKKELMFWLGNDWKWRICLTCGELRWDRREESQTFTKGKNMVKCSFAFTVVSFMKARLLLYSFSLFAPAYR